MWGKDKTQQNQYNSEAWISMDNHHYRRWNWAPDGSDNANHRGGVRPSMFIRLPTLVHAHVLRAAISGFEAAEQLRLRLRSLRWWRVPCYTAALARDLKHCSIYQHCTLLPSPSLIRLLLLAVCGHHLIQNWTCYTHFCLGIQSKTNSSQWSILSLHSSVVIKTNNSLRPYQKIWNMLFRNRSVLHFSGHDNMDSNYQQQQKTIFEPLPAVISASLLCVCFRRDCLHCTCRDCEGDQKAASLQAPPLSSTSPPLRLSLHHSSTYPKCQSRTGRLPSHQIHLDFH